MKLQKNLKLLKRTVETTSELPKTVKTPSKHQNLLKQSKIVKILKASEVGASDESCHDH